MQYEYKTKGTCSQRILFEIEDGIISNVQFIGGCNGNLQGIGKLVEGMKPFHKWYPNRVNHPNYGRLSINRLSAYD